MSISSVSTSPTAFSKKISESRNRIKISRFHKSSPVTSKIAKSSSVRSTVFRDMSMQSIKSSRTTNAKLVEGCFRKRSILETIRIFTRARPPTNAESRGAVPHSGTSKGFISTLRPFTRIVRISVSLIILALMRIKMKPNSIYKIRILLSI